MSLSLIEGEDRDLILDLRTSSGAPLDVAGWTIELRLGTGRPQVVKNMEVVSATTGRIRCVFVPGELRSLVGRPTYTLWRVDPGARRLLATGLATVEEVW